LEANIAARSDGIPNERRKEKTKERGALCCCAWANYDPVFHGTEKTAEQLMLRKSVCHLKYFYFPIL